MPKPISLDLPGGKRLARAERLAAKKHRQSTAMLREYVLMSDLIRAARCAKQLRLVLQVIRRMTTPGSQVPLHHVHDLARRALGEHADS